jgi:hypothetical protein
VDELLDLGFRYVLTGKFNQDCIEVEYLRHFFGVQAYNNSLNFLEIFRNYSLLRRLMQQTNCFIISSALSNADTVLPHQNYYWIKCGWSGAHGSAFILQGLAQKFCIKIIRKLSPPKEPK